MAGHPFFLDAVAGSCVAVIGGRKYAVQRLYFCQNILFLTYNPGYAAAIAGDDYIVCVKQVQVFS